MTHHTNDPKLDDPGILGELIDAARADLPSEAEWQSARRNLKERLDRNRKRSFIMSVVGKAGGTKFRWAAATVFAVVAIAAIIAVNPWGSGPGAAYAAIAQQLRNARTMTYTMILSGTGVPGVSQIRTEVAYKAPRYYRHAGPTGVVSVIDLEQKKMITLMGAQETYMEVDLQNLPENQNPVDMIESMRQLPERADGTLGEKELNGRKVQGYHVTVGGMEMKVWVDAGTRELVQVDGSIASMPGAAVVMTDFKFDTELDDSLFSLTPPEGYKRMEMKMDVSASNEQDLVYLLRLWASVDRGLLLPSSLKPIELNTEWLSRLKSLNASDIKEIDGYPLPLSNENLQAFTHKITRGMMFIMMLPPDSDWHYDGKGVALGAADRPIFWWRPAGSQNYKVIYGDLSIKEVPTDQVPQSATAQTQ